jgi:uncharacterized protein (TIGR02284 family)
MATRNDEVIGYLNDLIETCKDGEQGFRTAAEAIGEEGDDELRTMFNTYAQQRARFAAELQNEVLRRGGDPAEAGHVSGAFHRGWMNIKSLVTGRDSAAIIAECESGEDSAMRNYESALKQDLPSDLLAIVDAQYQEIRLAHDRIRAMEKTAKASGQRLPYM